MAHSAFHTWIVFVVMSLPLTEAAANTIPVTYARFDEAIAEGQEIVTENTDPNVAVRMLDWTLRPDLGIGYATTGVKTGSTLDKLHAEASLSASDAKVHFDAGSAIHGYFRVTPLIASIFGTPVPLDINFVGLPVKLDASAQRGKGASLEVYANGGAQFQLENSDYTADGGFFYTQQQFQHCDILTDGTKCHETNRTLGRTPVHVQAGYDYPFSLGAYIEVAPYLLQNADYQINGTADADPVITIDPSYPYKDEVRLDFSANLFSAASDVPEPGSILLVGAGLLGFVIQVRWRFSKTDRA